jgi:hypothetical protein
MTPDLRERLHSVDPPDADGAERRAWELATAAHAERAARVEVKRPRLAGGRRLAIVVGVLALTVAAAFTPAGATVGDWVRDVVRPGREDARPSIGPLPAEGRMLVSSPKGSWVVRRNGGSRRLGAYEQAGWSPRGLFVVGTRGRRLVAMEPDGTVRWAITAPAPVSHPAWSLGDGFRIAYLSGGTLRVVAGDGTGDRAFDRKAAAVTPAWRPGVERHLFAYGRRGGSVGLGDADHGFKWRSAPGIRAEALEWTRDGRRLVAMSPGWLRVMNPSLHVLGRTPMPTGTTATAMAVHPSGRSAAVVRRTPGGRSEVVSIPLRGRGGVRTLFAGAGTFTDLSWSPDGRWLLVAWREADQWLFIRSDRVSRIDAAKGIRRSFDPGGDGPGSFPRLGGWCCARR